MDYAAIILLAAKKIGVSGALLLAICTHETGLRNVTVQQDGGSASYGICQVKKDTAKMLGYKVKGKDLMNPAVNAEVAASYLRFQLNRYNNNMCRGVAAYNSGRFNAYSKVSYWPRNLKYVKRIQKLLVGTDIHDDLTCRPAVS